MKKQNSLIGKEQKTKIKFVFESTVSQRNFYIRNTNLNIRKLSKLFKSAPTSISIHIFNSRAAFLKAIHKKRVPDWFIACIPPRSTTTLYVLNDSDKLISKKKMLGQVLLHELTHLYTNTLNSSLPDWLKEGISIYVASQIFRPIISSAEWKNIAPQDIPFRNMSWRFAAEHNGYTIAGLLVVFFVRRFGWENFVSALDRCRSVRFSIESISQYFNEKPSQLMEDFKKQFVK